MHSSRMRTGHSLTVCWGGVCFQGGVCFRGVSASMGEFASGCLLPWGSLLPGGLLLGVVCFWGVSASGGVYPSMQWGRHPPHGQTHTCKNITLATSLRPEITLQFGAARTPNLITISLFSFSCSFRQRLWQIIGWHTHLGSWQIFP